MSQASLVTQHAGAPEALLAAEAALLETAGVPVERGEVEVLGVRLHYLSCGAGEPLLLLHGRGEAAALFAPILAPLAQVRRVIGLDLPGWGLSEKPPFTGRHAQDALDVWMASVFGFLDALGLDAVDLLGHSMGGFIALGCALSQPRRVRRLALADAAGLGTETGMDERLVYWLKPERLLRWLGPWALERGLRSTSPRLRASRGDPLFQFLYAVQAQREVIRSGARAFDRWVNLTGVHLTFTQRVRELAMPTLLLWGDRDPSTPYSNALRAARTLGPGHLVAFTGCGHTPFIERPGPFADVLCHWLDGGRVPTRV